MLKKSRFYVIAVMFTIAIMIMEKRPTVLCQDTNIVERFEAETHVINI